MDDDYAASEFPATATTREPMQVTAAHEYNHVLQYAYDILQDKWMFESTATWMEEKVFTRRRRLPPVHRPWAQRRAGRSRSRLGDKIYGSAVLNRWLDDHYGEEIVRRAWSVSRRTPYPRGGSRRAPTTRRSRTRPASRSNTS